MWLGRSSGAKRSLFQFISLHLQFFVLLTDLRKQPLIESHSQRLKTIFNEDFIKFHQISKSSGSQMAGVTAKKFYMYKW